MAIPTVNVTTHIEDSDGTSVEGAKVNFRLSEAVISTGVGHIIPTTITGTTDVNGNVVTPLWPNALGVTNSTYKVTIIGANTRDVTSLTASIPNTNCNLWDVANLPGAE